MEGTCASGKSICKCYKDFLSSFAMVFQLSRKRLQQEKVHNLKISKYHCYTQPQHKMACANLRARAHTHTCPHTEAHTHTHTWSLLHVPTHIQTVYTCTRVAVRPQYTYIANIRTIACIGTKKIMHEVVVRTPLEHQRHISKRAF